MIVVDVETGGLDPKKSALLSIGVVDMNFPDKTFYVEIKPEKGVEMNPKALEINDYNPDTWDNVNLDDAMFKFVAWCWGRDKTLAGHNPAFDRDFCNFNFKKAGQDFQFGYRNVDLHSVAYAAFTQEKIKFDKLRSDDIYDILDMPQEPRPHNALNGARYEAEAFSRLIYKKSLLEL